MSNLTDTLNEAERLIAARKYAEALLVLRTLREDPDLHKRVLHCIVMPMLDEMERVTTRKWWQRLGIRHAAPQIVL